MVTLRGLPSRPNETSIPWTCHAPDVEAVNTSVDMVQLVREVFADVKDIETYYNINFSRTRIERLCEYLEHRINELKAISEDPGNALRFSNEARVDWLLLWDWASRRLEDLHAERAKVTALAPLLGWIDGLVQLLEKRQKVVRFQGQDAAQVLADAATAATQLAGKIKSGQLDRIVSRSQAYRATREIDALRSHLKEWHSFYDGYDPLISWWVREPYERLQASIEPLLSTTRSSLVGINSSNNDAIVGQPSGRDSILADLAREVIAYSPEEILDIGHNVYSWCEEEMVKASRDLGYGKDWRKALEYVKGLYVEPGEQTYMVHELAQEAVDYVTERDMVTIPEICNETWRTYMMSPEAMKTNPFFLGGPYIQVSYPTSGMTHEDKMMIMRGNSRPFSRSTVFHELIPGHHLQWHYMDRHNTHKKNFLTPFWTEGWAFYWEMILWDRGFPETPPDRIGMLFWRMHRCTRIVFSLKFHLGEWSPQQCIDYLVDKGGHERATAKGEVRRSFNGDYSPLYQAGYMLGALQFYALREEIVETGRMSEKEFHDRILRMNQMPVEYVRALLKQEKLDWKHKPSWRFYDGSHKR